MSVSLSNAASSFVRYFHLLTLRSCTIRKCYTRIFRSAGSISQNECYVRLFVMKYLDVGGLLVPDGEVAVFCPLLLVSNTWSAFAGRDVLGFPKLNGTLIRSPRRTPSRPSQPRCLPPLASGSRRKPNRSHNRTGPRQSRSKSRQRQEVALGTHRHRRHPSRSSGSGEIGRSYRVVFRIRNHETVSGPGAAYQRLLPGDPAIRDIRRLHRRIRAAAGGADQDQRLCNPQTCREPRDCPRRMAQADVAISLECSFFFGETVPVFENQHSWWQWWWWR